MSTQYPVIAIFLGVGCLDRDGLLRRRLADDTIAVNFHHA